MMQETHVLDPRRAGQIERYGVFPHISRQTTGEHSWQVARLLLALWPDAPRHMLVHALVHDVGELWAGDCSWHSKRADPDLKHMLDQTEHNAHLQMVDPWALPGPQALSTMERAVFKATETLEMWEWAWHEINLGNKYAHLVEQRCRTALQDMALPPFIQDNLSRYLGRRNELEDAVNGP